jgi:hypothetical protein
VTEFEIDVLAVLKRIATAVESMVVEDEPTPEQPPACAHPIEARVSFGETMGVDDWQCGLCGFRTVTDG